MKINKKWLLLALMLTVSAVFLFTTGDVGAVYTGIDGGYVGTAVCASCHTTQNADFQKSGHPYKYRATGGLTPTDPISALFTTPFISALNIVTPDLRVDADSDGHLDWSAINYVIGGFGWKQRWGIKDTTAGAPAKTGYVWSSTSSGASGAQFNILAQVGLDPLGRREDWSSYGSGAGQQAKKYNCAVCHNTNGQNIDSSQSCYVPAGGRTEPWATNPGMDAAVNHGGYYSEWTFDGVQCEACHGAGETHSNTPSKTNITSNTSLDACGKCHTRILSDQECYGTGTIGAMTAGGYIKHHEQYNEMVATAATPGVHATLTCVACHDPHKRAHKVPDAVATALGITDNNLSAEARGAVVACSTCHQAQKDADNAAIAGKKFAHKNAGVTCQDCHMAEATKSATAAVTASWGKKGDVKSHIFKIDPSGTAADTASVNPAKNYLSLEYACGKCHAEAGGKDGNAGTTTVFAAKADASAEATGYHNVTGIDNGYVGSSACAGCHTEKYDSFVQTGHPYKIRTTKGLTPVMSGGNGTTTITDPISALLPMPLGSNINTSTLGDGCYDVLLNPTSKFECDAGLDGILGTADDTLSWSSVQYVIGGYGWKARWGLKDNHTSTCSDTSGVCKTGYVVVGADGINGNNNGTQYNVMSADAGIDPGNHVENWSDYNNNTDKGYDCAICHNTNGAVNANTQCTTTGNMGYRTQPWTNMGWAPNGAGNISSPAGFKSEWTFDGVQCEACHGPASSHVAGGSAKNVLAITDSNATAGVVTTAIVATPYADYKTALTGNIEICAKCHMRGSTVTGGKEWGCAADKKTLRYGAEMQGATGTTGPNGNYNADFQKHHEQYNELVGYNPTTSDPAAGDGAHASLTCTTCHDPHQRSHKLTQGVATALGVTDKNSTPGVITTCESCHGTGTPLASAGGADHKVSGLTFNMGADIKCIDCHMGETIRSAPTRAEIGTWGKKGDVKSHVFKVNSTSTSILRTNADSKPIAQNYVTVDYACGKCHDSSMNDYVGIGLTQAQAQLGASKMHTGGLVASDCTVCHSSGGPNGPVSTAVNHTTGAPGPTSCSSCHTNAHADGAPTAASHASCTDCHATIGGGAASEAQVLTRLTLGMHSAPVTLTFGYTTSGLTVNVDASGSANATGYDWDCGGGTSGGNTVISSCTYATGGTYTITLSNRGASVAHDVTAVAPDLPPAALHGTVTTTAATVSFNDASTDDHGVSTVSVNWGDGGMVSTGAQNGPFSHTYLRSGTFTVTHNAVDTIGQVNTEIFTVTANVAAAPTYSISGTVKNLAGTNLVGAMVTVKNTTTGLSKTAYSTASGYTVTGLKNGPYSIKVVKVPYTFSTTMTTTISGANVTYNIQSSN